MDNDPTERITLAFIRRRHGRQCRVQGETLSTETALLVANGKSAGPGAFQDGASRRRSSNKRYAARNFVFQSIISGEVGK